MNTIEDVEQCLQEGLPQLYSPTYHPPELMWLVTGSEPDQGAETVQAAVIRAIEDLRPAAEAPPNARIRRLYQLLACRYLQGLTQKETAQRLGITSRHLRREQKQAIRMLAERLWQQQPGRAAASQRPGLERPLPEPDSAEGKSSGWRSQVRQELASLQQNAPGAVADVGATLAGAVKSGQALASKHGVDLSVEPARRRLMATIQPSVLREVLITTIEKLVQQMSSGEITLRAEREKDRIIIMIMGYPTTAESPPHSDFIQEVLAPQGGTVSSRVDDDCITFLITLPAADKITVAVIEDNADLVHFYRHYTTRTRYQIAHVTDMEHAFGQIIDLGPEIIVMDILLPEIDGWELLAQLHQHPATRSTPVIICSVVRREELALAFGAALYVPKPVRRQQFIQALDQVLTQASAGASKVQAKTAESD
jgi:CheY-like chemotaxis protein